MKKKYALINRADGAVLKQKVWEADTMERVYHKPRVWIEVVQEDIPIYNKDTEKAVRTVTQSDLSNMAVDVLPTEARVQGYDIISLDAGELQVINNNKIASTDGGLIRIIEDLVVAIASGTTLDRTIFTPQALAKINNRRDLRGKAPI